MPIVNLTGAQGAQTIDCTVDEPHITGNCTQNAATTTAFIPGAGPSNPLRWDGNFNYTVSTSGKVTSVGTSTQKLRWQPNGAPSTWSGVPNTSPLLDHSSTGAPDLEHTDFYYTGVIFRPTAGTGTVAKVRFYGGENAVRMFSCIQTGGTHTITDIEAVNFTNGTAINLTPTGGTNTFARMTARGCSSGINISPTGGTNTWSDFKTVDCTTQYTFGGSVAVIITNLAIIGVGGISGVFGASSTITRLMRRGPSVLQWTPSPGAGNVQTVDESYIENSHGFIINGGAVADAVVQNSVFASSNGQSYGNNAHVLNKVTSSGNDVVQHTASGSKAIGNGTSDNDFIAASNTAFMGIAKNGTGTSPAPNTGFYGDWADTNFNYDFDPDSGNATSTSVPSQYGTLTANRTNARATANKPLTVSGIATSGLLSYTVQIDFNTGIRAQSRILLSTSSGFDTQAPEIATPWKYDGFISPDKIGDWTLPATAHTHNPILRPNTRYYWRAECIDPCGRRFLSTEQSVTTAQAVPPEAASQPAPRDAFCHPFKSGG